MSSTRLGRGGLRVPTLLTRDLTNSHSLLVEEGLPRSSVCIVNVSGQSALGLNNSSGHIVDTPRDVWLAISGADERAAGLYPNLFLLLAGASITLPGDRGDIYARSAQLGDATVTVVVTIPE